MGKSKKKTITNRLPFRFCTFKTTYMLHPNGIIFNLANKSEVPSHFVQWNDLRALRLGQALTLLVTVSSMCYHTSTPALSTSSSSRGFTSFEWDISS